MELSAGPELRPELGQEQRTRGSEVCTKLVSNPNLNPGSQNMGSASHCLLPFEQTRWSALLLGFWRFSMSPCGK